jgi:periplasmic protein TonB
MKNEKKNPKLVPSRNFNFQIGLAVSFGLALVAFEWQTPDYVIKPFEGVYTDLVEEEAIPITRAKEEIIKPKLRNPTIEKIVKEIPVFVEEKPEIIISIPEIGSEMDSLFLVEPEIAESVPFVPWAEVMPTFVGGEKARLNYLQNEIKYPKDAKIRGISDVVYVSFVVDNDGTISRVKAENNPGGGLAQEAIRVVEKMPKWNSGKQASLPVAVKLTMPIKFIIQ